MRNTASFITLRWKKKNCETFIVSSWPKDRVEAIVAMGGSGDRVLDIGCGNGLLLYQFRKSYKTLLGLEYSPKCLAQACMNLSGLDFVSISGSVEDMAIIESESIDRIISADTIEHMLEVYTAATEMLRVLKPGGVLVINTPNIAFLKSVFCC